MRIPGRLMLTITKTPDWRAALRQAGKAGQDDTYRGEALSFESPNAFFGRLTVRRWDLVTAWQRASRPAAGRRRQVSNLTTASEGIVLTLLHLTAFASFW